MILALGPNVGPSRVAFRPVIPLMDRAWDATGAPGDVIDHDYRIST